MKVVYKEDKEPKKYYQQLCCDELKRLNCFTSWYIDENLNLKLKCIKASNDTMMVILGAVQEELLKTAYFEMGYRESALSLVLSREKTWKDVYKILSSIDHIDVGRKLYYETSTSIQI